MSSSENRNTAPDAAPASHAFTAWAYDTGSEQGSLRLDLR